MSYPDHNSIFIIILLSCVLILILIIFITFVVAKYQYIQVQYFKELAIIEKRYQGNLLKTQSEIQEGTFKQIAREIHDNFGQKLSFVKLQLSQFMEMAGSVDRSLVDNSLGILSGLTEELRDFSRGLVGDILKKMGLIAAIEKEVSLLRNINKFEVHLKIFGQPTYENKDVDLFAFRIVQEALQNIIKHSEANKVTINIRFSTEYLEMDIKDDGIGFNASQIHLGEGLRNMKERVDMLNGSMDLLTGNQSGTELIIKIPLYEHKTSHKNLFCR